MDSDLNDITAIYYSIITRNDAIQLKFVQITVSVLQNAYCDTELEKEYKSIIVINQTGENIPLSNLNCALQ
jgi:hypothetical protein